MAGKILMIVFLVLMVAYVTLKIIELVKKAHDRKKKKAQEVKADVAGCDSGCCPIDQDNKR